MSKFVSPSSAKISHEPKRDEKEEDLRLRMDERDSIEESALLSGEMVKNDCQNTRNDNSVNASRSQVVYALEKELNERRKQIVTSFKLQELNVSERKTSIKSEAVVWEKAEEQ